MDGNTLPLQQSSMSPLACLCRHQPDPARPLAVGGMSGDGRLHQQGCVVGFLAT